MLFLGALDMKKIYAGKNSLNLDSKALEIYAKRI